MNTRLNLNTTHSLTDPSRSYPTNALPVLVDLNWYGRIMTTPNGGITNNGHITEPNRLSL